MWSAHVSNFRTYSHLKKKMIGIYKITSPSGRIYIRQSRNIKSRLSRYRNHDCKNQPALYNSILKYGFNNHKFEILEECILENLNFRERYYQEFYNSVNNGLNCEYTKTEDKPKILSEARRQQISRIHKGKITSEETKEKIRNNNHLGIKLSDEQRNNISLGMRGKCSKLTIEQVKEIKELFKLKVTNKQISEKYCVSKSTIKDIKSGRRWNYV